jgi:hypothetical protein
MCRHVAKPLCGCAWLASAPGIGTNHAFALPRLLDAEADDAIAEYATPRRLMRLSALLPKEEN